LYKDYLERCLGGTHRTQRELDSLAFGSKSQLRLWKSRFL